MTRSASRQDVVEGVQRQTRGPLWPRSRRRVLALGYLVAVGLAAFGGLLNGAGRVVSPIGVLAAAVLFVLLRKATRLVAEAPDVALDDLLVRLRGECFVMGYQYLAASSALIGAVLLIGGTHGLSAGAAGTCGLLLLGLALGLPVVLTALTLPDVDR
ncbi:MAG TPA: hypothetical protein VHN80_06095 [Kineosporiaceae bacterium]|nr:hypothetical protein [Kineosporiaceae bacterium]